MTDTASQGTPPKPATPPAPATGADGTEGTGENAEPKPTETVEFWKNKAREQERRAKDNSAAATELAALKAAQQTAEERLATERDAALRLAEEARAETLRYKVATKYKISDEDTETFLTGTDEETLVRQAERLAALAVNAGTPSAAPRPDLSQGGRSPSAQTTPAQEFGKFLAGALDKA